MPELCKKVLTGTAERSGTKWNFVHCLFSEHPRTKGEGHLGLLLRDSVGLLEVIITY